MSRLPPFGVLFLFFVLLFGCSSNSHIVDSDDVNELINGNSLKTDELSQKENVEEIAEATEEIQEKNVGNNSV